MKITAIEVYGYELSYAHGEYVMSGDRVARTQSSTVTRVCTDEGLDGWGEVCTLGATYLPAHAGGARAAIAEMAPSLIGLDPTNLVAVNQALDAALLGHRYAKSPLDIACWDLLGKRAGLPVSTLLGGVAQPDFPLYEAVPLAGPDEMAAFVTRRRAAGIEAFQLKVGNDPRDDARRVEAVVEVAGPDTLVIADANGGWSLRQAVVAARLLRDQPIHLEQPCRSTEDCALLRPHVELPLVMDESIVTPGDMVEAKSTTGAASVNLKLSRVGGLSGGVRMRDLALGLGLSVSIEDQWGGDLATAAVSHLAAGTRPDALLSTSFFNDWTNEHIAGHRPRSRQGRGCAPLGPGLGVEVDPGSLGTPLLRF